MNERLIQNRAAGIKAMLEREDAAIRESHRSGAGGSEIVQRRTALIDRVLRDVYHALSAVGPMPLLIAVGGYGRGELNPHSDIDILFLCRGEQDRQRSPEMLYVLWDAGLDVGYSVRSIPECVELGRRDIQIRTSLMESRLIAGDPVLFHTFLSTMHTELFYRQVADFIRQKIADRNETRRKYGSSIYLREPNIKEGAGGLRDAHTVFWIASAHFRAASLADLIPRGVVSEKQYTIFRRSRNFLWRIRNEIHYLSERKNDHLTFDLQEQTAAHFGYHDSLNLLGVEHFMKAYFLHARNIKEFSNLIMEHALKKPTRHWFSRTIRLGPFSLIGKMLIPASDNILSTDPVSIVTAFDILKSRRVTFSDRLKSMVLEHRIDDALRNSPSAARIFIHILDAPDNLSETLTLMKDVNFLGRYIPEFRAIQALAKHDYYHKYTVDEHILQAIANLQSLWTGRFPGLSTLYEAMKSIRKRWILMLAVLLHDLGKAYRVDHEHKGVELAERILTRLSVSADDRERVLFLIRNHLVMSSLSQRRELTDRKVIAEFSRLVRDRENLKMLYLLTYADISAVSPTSWTQWKAALLQDLYVKTLSHFDEKTTIIEGERTRLHAASERIREEARDVFPLETINSFLAIMPESYLLYTPPERAIDHMRMMAQLPTEGLVIRHRHNREGGYTELTVCAYDAYGMLYRTSGTIAAKNLNIHRAQAFTSKNGIMIDTFTITGPDGNLCTYEDVWESVKAELKSALTGEQQIVDLRSPVSERTGSVPQESSITFDNDTSDTCTIIDITAWDRIGLLYRITRTFFELNLDITSAKIVTEGVRVMDSFYITDLLRKKIVDAERIAKITEALKKVLN